MELIRTDRAAMLSGASMVGLFVLIGTRTGLAVAPQAGGTLDRAVMLVILAGVVYASLFWLGHELMRQSHRHSRVAYAAIGAFAALPAFAAAIGLAALGQAIHDGRLTGALAVPLAAGGLVGFLYQRRAGYDRECDDPAAVQAVVGEASDGDAVHAGLGEFFDVPLVVRTSPGAIFVSALLASSVLMLTIFFGIATNGMPGGMPPSMSGPGFGVMSAIIGGAMPIALCIYFAHLIVRGRGRTSYLAYGLSGALGPFILSLMLFFTGMGPAGFLIMGQFIVPSMIAMLAYRRLAGIEPKPIAEDIEVSDRRTLIGADHPRRKFGRVIDVSRR